MIVQVLGCSSAIAAVWNLSFLVDDDVLIDAGTGVGDSLASWTHRPSSSATPHLDHVLPSACWPNRRDARAPPAGRRPIRHTLPGRWPRFNGVNLARLHAPAQRRATGAGCCPLRRRQQIEVARQAHRGDHRFSHRVNLRLRGRRRRRRAGGSIPATPAPTRRCGSPAPRDGAPGDRNGLQRRGAPAPPTSTATSARPRSTRKARATAWRRGSYTSHQTRRNRGW